MSGATAAKTAARIAVTTTLSASSGGLSALVLRRFTSSARSWYVPAICNGVLAGLVSITSGCATLDPWASVLTGVLGAVSMLGASRLMLRCGIDDIVDATAVHGACGLVGLLSAALLSADTYTAEVFGAGVRPGPFYAGGSVRQLGVASAFILATIAWVGVSASIVFLGIRALGLLRAADGPGL